MRLVRMTFSRFGPTARIAAFLAVVGFSGVAHAASISVNIFGGGGKVGEINVGTQIIGTDEGINGSFDVTKKNPDGTTMTLDQLEAFLKQDHLNWFQKVTKVDPAIPGLDVPFVDPPSGGLGSLWADDIPWYWDEVRPPDPLPPGKTSPPTVIPPGNQTELDTKSVGSKLGYSDFPGGQPNGTVVEFSTFLISDYGNKTYSVMGGFTWAIKIQGDGTTDVTSLTAGAKFIQEFADEIKAFGWTHVPEPSGLALAGAATTLVVGFARVRRRAARAAA